MIIYLLYRVGIIFCLSVPTKVSYAVACAAADVFFYLSPRDRGAVINNLTMVTDKQVSDKTVNLMARDVFRNFGKYLVDFFRSPKVDNDYLAKHVKIEGRSHIDEALAKGKGAILLSAHIGNWELGATVTSMMGYRMSAVVLTHKNKRINDLFTSYRLMGNTKPIELGNSLKYCYRALRNNELLALMGDRDFSKNGMLIDFFGKPAKMPIGPAKLSRRMGAPIVPVFLVREKDDTYRFFTGRPIYPVPGPDEETAVRDLMVKCLAAIESCIKKYPAQWSVFRDIWGIDGKETLRPDTII